MSFFPTTKKTDDPHYLLMHWIKTRQDIFWKRYYQEQPPWTPDPIFNKVKFTNVYRMLDRESQNLLRYVIYNGKQYDEKTMLFRILLFRHFNTLRTWQLLEQQFGDITLEVPKKDYVNFLNQHTKLYNKAYMLNTKFTDYDPYKYCSGTPKHNSYFEIYSREIFDNGYFEQILASKSMRTLYNRLSKITAFGSFMSMQTAIDLNYSTLFNFSENDFIVAGLGAQRGINRVFGKQDNYENIIHTVHNTLYTEMNKYGLSFVSLPNYDPTLMDIQNCLCEIGKYLKQLAPDKTKKGEIHVSHHFRPTYNKINYTFPPKWNIKL